MTITRDRLVELLKYDSDDGLFRWRVKRSRSANIGSVAGTPDKDGYTHIKIAGRVYKAHRLAWLYVTGDWPKDQIDHINLEKSDNRFANLREATKSQNMADTRCRSVLGVKGVYMDKRRNRYVAQIIKDGVHTCLGSYQNLSDAARAYAVAARKNHREFARV